VAQVALNLLEGCLDVLQRTFKNLREASCIEEECSSDAAIRVICAGASQNLPDFGELMVGELCISLRLQ
jgi:hypothetical protein